MKKVLTLVLAVLMLLAAVCCFAGCGKEEKKVLKMATNAYFPPYEFYEGEKIVGIDAEIAEAIAKKLGMELVIEDMAFDSILTAVQNGSVDFGMLRNQKTSDFFRQIRIFETEYP